MSQGVLEAIGGLGLFLLGMHVLTTGLKQLAGRSLRTTLRRFTRSPTSGAVAGAVTTAVIQSSSATTVTAVGFVGAGLLTFGEALGIIFGANIGTTMTGWFVALFGFKVPLGTLAFPFVLAGALLRLLGRGRWSAVGEAVAGFGVIFVGIDLLQTGLVGLEGTVTPESFPPNTLFGRVQLVGIGVLITLVTQSSSAGVAMALASVHTGTIEFPQAAAIVIGMDIGTTVTAAMAVIGGGTQVRRTGMAHVIYNCITGIGAFILLVPYVEVVERLGSGSVLESQPEILLVGFHTLFNGLGVLAVLPFADRFAAFIERIVREPGDQPTHALGRSYLSDADAALDVVDKTLQELSMRCLTLTVSLWRTGSHMAKAEAEIDRLEASVVQTREYTLQINSHEASHEVQARHEAALHLIDHLERLLERLRRTERIHTAAHDPELRELGRPLMECAEAMAAAIREGRLPQTDEAELIAEQLVDQVRPYRGRVIEGSLGGGQDPASIDARLDANRWLTRMAAHVWRIGRNLDRLTEASLEIVPTEADLDI